MRRDDELAEQEAVRRPGSGKAVGPIPRGIEVLVKKAAVDPAFKQVLLENRARAADEIGLKLEPAEVAMLNAVPAAQLEAIIANSNVTDLTRSAFLGRAAAVMLAALGVSTQGCGGPPVTGSAPDRIPTKGMTKDNPKPDPDPSKDLPPAAAQSPGTRPDPVEPKPPGQETAPPAPTGIRPDKPPVEPKREPTSEPPPKVEEPGISKIPVTGIRPGDRPLTKGIQPDMVLQPGLSADVIKRRVEAIVGLMGSPEEGVREEARKALLGMGPAILPTLREAKPTDATVRKDVEAIIETLELEEARQYYGRQSLGIRPDLVAPPSLSAAEIKKRVDAMVGLLGSPEPNVRVEAKQALLGMGPQILPSLKEAKAPNADAEKEVQAIVQALEAKE